MVVSSKPQQKIWYLICITLLINSFFEQKIICIFIRKIHERLFDFLSNIFCKSTTMPAVPS